MGGNKGFPWLLDPKLGLIFDRLSFYNLSGLVLRRLPPCSPLLPSLHSAWLLASLSPQESSRLQQAIFVTGKSLVFPWHEETLSAGWCSKSGSAFSICQRRWSTVNWKRVNYLSSFSCCIFSSPGMLRFSRGHEAALSELFEELKQIGLKNKDERTFAQRCLKKTLMASPHDIRGSRRLHVIFSLMEVGTKIGHWYHFWIR